ncbi:MAG: acyltransferase [Oscillospiraceae bacterium]|nr:acyltransferase [Oscillospiraceae bacterium]
MEHKENINYKLNLLKGFACIGVVFIHITFPGIFGEIVKLASDYAVPIFFMIAGYYAFGNGTAVVKRRLIKIIKIFVYAYLLFFALKAADAIMNHEIGVLWLCDLFNWKTAIKCIVFCTIDFAIPLWYLIAMIETYIVWYFIVKNQKEQFTLKILPFLFVLQILLTSYCETMQLEWFWKINFPTRAMPWFLLGYYMHTDKAKKIRNIDSHILVILAAAGCVIAVIPTLFSLPLKFTIIGYLPYSVGLFALSLKNPYNSVCKVIEYIGEKLSLNIYIFHSLINSVTGFMCHRILGIDTETCVWQWCRPIIVLICTILASWLVHIILNNIKSRTKSTVS